jgi:hypothetical protein
MFTGALERASRVLNCIRDDIYFMKTIELLNTVAAPPLAPTVEAGPP